MSRVLLATLTLSLGIAALSLAFKPVAAGVLETPAGGFGVTDHPVPAPRPDGFASSAGGAPNI